jgi:ubiquinone/menaquinone biosynthesis C-methylase UbiE
MINIKEKIEHENRYWSNVFTQELRKKNEKDFSSFWWEDYYTELSGYIKGILSLYEFNNILEAGSGSGKASILLNKRYEKVFLDISVEALKYAEHLAKKFHSNNVDFIEGDIFKMPFNDKQFDFVWNIGVIEHYEINEIELIVEEMSRVCKEGGCVAIGFPNLYSGPTLKALLLKWIKFIPGYRINSEKFYRIDSIQDIFYRVSKKFWKSVNNGNTYFYIKNCRCFFIKSFKE